MITNIYLLLPYNVTDSWLVLWHVQTWELWNYVVVYLWSIKYVTVANLVYRWTLVEWNIYHMPSKWDRIISALVTWIKNISRVSEANRGRYELIQVTCAEIILSHFESIWLYFSHTFHYFTDEISESIRMKGDLVTSFHYIPAMTFDR